MTLPRTAWVACFVLTVACGAWPARADVSARRAELYAAYAKQLDELAASFRQQNENEAADEISKWLPQRDPQQLTLFVLPASTAIDATTGSQLPEWRKRWQTLRDAQAEALYRLARQAVGEQRPSLVYELVTEAVRENPQHRAARKLLGYVEQNGAWLTPFEVRQLGAGKVWHDKFGWLPRAQVERYEKGERYYQGRWMPAEDEARLRGDLKRGWRVESAHYVVTTNHSLEEGVRLSQSLERLYGVWQQAFIAYLADEAELARRFEGHPPRWRNQQHNVVCYRTRDEYSEALRSVQAQIEISLGLYLDKTRTAYFFAGAEQEPGTVFHEATHQLFHEARRVSDNAARNNNFWVVEGIACYMESLADRGGYVTLGGANAGRMPAARHRLLTDDFYVPLDELVTSGMQALQHDARIAALYSQSAGLADFLMHGESGRYREPLVRYLVAVYSGRASERTLEDLAGVDYATLDRQYRVFMSEDVPSGEQKAAAAPHSASR